jgi:hypothetical protein
VRFLPPAGLNHTKRKALGTLDGEAFLLSAWCVGSLVIHVPGRNPKRGDYRIDPKVFRPARLEERADAGSPVAP